MAGRDPTARALFVWMAIVFIFLYAPIAVVVLYSFNGGRNLYIWEEFSTFWYSAVFENPRVINALYVSLRAAAINVVIAVGLGVLAGLRSRGERVGGPVPSCSFSCWSCSRPSWSSRSAS